MVQPAAKSPHSLHQSCCVENRKMSHKPPHIMYVCVLVNTAAFKI
jgi:hypothetical protein